MITRNFPFGSRSASMKQTGTSNRKANTANPRGVLAGSSEERHKRRRESKDSLIREERDKPPITDCAGSSPYRLRIMHYGHAKAAAICIDIVAEQRVSHSAYRDLYLDVASGQIRAEQLPVSMMRSGAECTAPVGKGSLEVLPPIDLVDKAEDCVFPRPGSSAASTAVRPR